LQIPLDNVVKAIAATIAFHRDSPIHAVVASDDATVELASEIAAALGLPHNPVSAVRLARRKDLARFAQQRAGIEVPVFQRLDLDAPIPGQVTSLMYPVVLKPLALSGSRGVMRANNEDELLRCVERLRPIIAHAYQDEERRFALIEAYLPGDEVAVEGMLTDGRFSLKAIFDKPEPLVGPFFEESYYVTPSRLALQLQQQLERAVARLCEAYGLRTGPVHAELRMNADKIWPLEIAARTIGGDCARLFTFGTGYSLEMMVLAHALSVALPVTEASNDAAGVLMIPIPRTGVLRRVEGVLEASRVVGVEDVFIAAREGHEIIALPEGSSYLGFVFARGPDPESVYLALREAHAALNIVTAPIWRIEALG
jgi:biotin carboxylase